MYMYNLKKGEFLICDSHIYMLYMLFLVSVKEGCDNGAAPDTGHVCCKFGLVFW